ncbi:hypothetical protein [Pontibacter oryzae]|uniref:GAF domain-containing protein n=1 Tax=Pontibacter oryzae TaxID=2304593 RepID=A0A399SJS4_9BACT|nr:hypothetical protein [Pontibacter oryzae]RIJ42015.1 hypothetical protein D1627_08440 [Pontibacter oryzae]
MNSTVSLLDNFSVEFREFNDALSSAGAYGALRYLNKRTPHRFTGVYKYVGNTLQNIVLYDRYDPTIHMGADTPLAATYCSLLQKQQALEINDASEDERVKGVIETSVVSYCGVSIKDDEGNPFGSLCHFDMNRCQERYSDFPLLEAAAKVLYNYIHSDKFTNQ